MKYSSGIITFQKLIKIHYLLNGFDNLTAYNVNNFEIVNNNWLVP